MAVLKKVHLRWILKIRVSLNRYSFGEHLMEIDDNDKMTPSIIKDSLKYYNKVKNELIDKEKYEGNG